ncbi:MAG: hypothetical protein LWW74_06815 [Burkholderiales bacterium]|nr:hypothetical protein [Burkholderiales bacterium]
MFEGLKVFLHRLANAIVGREYLIDSSNTQNNYASGNNQNNIQGGIVYQADIMHFHEEVVTQSFSGLSKEQIEALERILDTIPAMRKVAGEFYSREYFAKQINKIAEVDDWHKMPAGMYDRAVRYLMKCVGFVAIENTTTQN